MVLTRGGLDGRGPIIRRRRSNASPRHSTHQTAANAEINDNSWETNHHYHMDQEYIHQEDMESEDSDGDHTENGEAVEFPDETDNPNEKVLHKTEGLWFYSREVVDEVVETSYKTYFMGPWNNWYNVPKDAKAIWWKAFKTKFSWDPLMAKMVKKGWQQKCSRLLTRVICKMFTKKGYRAKWCHPSIRKRLAAIRATDAFKKRSAQYSLNRKRPGKEMPIHCQGSKSTEQIRIDLEKKLQRVPTASELYYECHVKKDNNFVDETAQKVWDDFQNKKISNMDNENPRNEDELLLEALGGWKNGRVYGLGSATDNYYVKPHNDNPSLKAQNELVTNLQNHVQELSIKNLEQAKELEETKASLVEANTKLNETTEKLD